MGSLGCWGTSSPWQGNWMISKVHSNPSHSMIVLQTSPAHFSNSWIRSHKNHCQKHIHKRNIFHGAGPAQRQMGKRDRVPSRHVMHSAYENTRCGKKDPSKERFPIATQEGLCWNTLQGNVLYLETTSWQRSCANI